MQNSGSGLGNTCLVQNSLLGLGLVLPLPSDRMVDFFSVTSTLDGERKGESPESHHRYRFHFMSSLRLNLLTLIHCILSLLQCNGISHKLTWDAVQFGSGLDGGDSGDDGPVWHYSSVNVYLLGGGE